MSVGVLSRVSLDDEGAANGSDESPDRYASVHDSLSHCLVDADTIYAYDGVDGESS